MEKPLFIDLLCALLAIILLWAAIVDIRTRRIANRLNLTIALMAPLFWWATGTDLWPDAAIRVAVAMSVYLLFALAFQMGLMGGGDVKLAAALALWFPPGGTLLLIVMIEHKVKKNEGRPEVPYGVAIAFGGLWLLAQRFLNHFA